MVAAEILRALSGTLESAVLFRLEALRPLLDDVLLAHMFSLPGSVDLRGSSHVVLVPTGPLLAPESTGPLANPVTGSTVPPVAVDRSLAARFRGRLALLPHLEPDCLGLGAVRNGEDVALHVRIEGLLAEGVAAFGREPPRQGSELLRAVGVDYLGGVLVDGVFVGRFRNRLDEHLLAGALAGFSRTDHCNRFFLRGGVVDRDVRDGLLGAAAARIAHGRARVRRAVEGLGPQARAGRLTLVCEPPPPAAPEPYGDLVPMGLLAAALGHGDEAEALRSHLRAHARDGLWSFHVGGLPTATDSALVLLGINNPSSADSLQRFATEDGGYVPQRCAQRATPGHMRITRARRHWCEPDIATTALVVAVRRRADRPVERSWRWLAQHLDVRSGRFFANPFLTDWALALAFAGTEAPARPADRLREELLAAQNVDGSFGRYDNACATAFAILALATLGVRGRPVLRAQLRLLDWMTADGTFPAATPFFSSLAKEGSGEHAVTFYRDPAAMISTAAALLSLSIDAGNEPGPTSVAMRGVPARYCCHDPEEYVRTIVLGSSPATAAARGQPSELMGAR